MENNEKKITVKCICCNDKFQARVVDRKRGHGLYCSKSCKAKKQKKKTVQYEKYVNRHRTEEYSEDIDEFGDPCFSNAHLFSNEE